MKTRILIIITAMLLAISGMARPLIHQPSRWHNVRINSYPTTVFAIEQDQDGLMWIGTNGGLFSYDGHRLRHAATLAPEALSQAHIHAIVTVGEDDLYLASNNGLLRYHKPTGQLERLEAESLPGEMRAAVEVDGRLWLGSLFGLFTYDLATGTVEHVATPMGHQAVYALLVGPKNEIYVGTYDGLGCYYPQLGEWHTLKLLPASRSSILFVNALAFQPGNQRLIVGTENGLWLYDLLQEKAEEVRDIPEISVKALAISPLGTLYIGSDKGVYILTPDGQLELCRHDSRQEMSLANNVVWTLFLDKEQALWGGTEDGLSLLAADDQMERISLSALTGRGDGSQVFTIMRDDKGRLWIGGSNGLIEQLTDGSTRWFNVGDPSWPISHSRIRQIYQTSDGAVWTTSDGGLNRLDETTGQMINYRLTDATHRRNANWAYNMVEDEDGTLWVGSYLGGVMMADYQSLLKSGGNYVADSIITQTEGLPNDFISQLIKGANGQKWVLNFRDSTVTLLNPRQAPLSIDIKSLTGSYPQVIIADEGGRIWCGFEGGVALISPEGEVERFIRFPGSANGNVLALENVGQQLWVSTMGGVWAIDKLSLDAHLLPLPEESYTALYYDEEGHEVLMGALDAIYRVDPLRVAAHKGPAHQVRVMSVMLDGEPLLGGEIGPTMAAFSESPRLSLPPDYHTAQLEVSALDFLQELPLRYAYQIDDRDLTWNLLDEGQNVITLPRLPYGAHRLSIKVAGAEAEPLVILLNVARPWYITWWAFLIYLLILGVIAWLVTSYFRRRTQRIAERHERALTMATVQNRISFLTDMSHELKTPLAMILGPVSQMREEASDPRLRRRLDTIYDNAVRLNTLVHCAVEINRMENTSVDQMLIHYQADVVYIAKHIFDNYRQAHPDKHFVFTASQPSIMASLDVVKTESILNNLLSNACKYTDKGATISCSVEQEADEIVIIVSDDGVGIPESEQGMIFQRMFRSARTANNREGTGIGLYLVKQYVELHGGRIEVRSREDEGTAFVIHLPMGDISNLHPALADEGQGIADEEVIDTSRQRVLIVDDNQEIVKFVSEILADDYTILTAGNGRAGLAVATTFHPDVIIADEMMPVMTGLEMCRSLKSNPYLSTIPIIMLTAKDDSATEAESLAAGVDAFMAKPFEAPMLKARIAQLLKAREAMMQQLRMEKITTPQPIVAESVAEKQMAQVTNVIETHIADPDLNVSFVSDNTGINAKQLYRLIKKYTGSSPVDYIRQIRLRKAALLLEQKKFTISEVMYMVGFSSSSYFAKCFQAQYGVKPSQYVAQDSPPPVS
ncbi:MAG: response regulator [Bacteroidales bacterium]|nr:response regulator [Bacteroidales bacterium]